MLQLARSPPFLRVLKVKDPRVGVPEPGQGDLGLAEGWRLVTRLRASLASPGPGLRASGREIWEDLALRRQ